VRTCKPTPAQVTAEPKLARKGAGANFEYKIARSDDIMGTSIVTWWNPKNTPFEVFPNFSWFIE
jgi:hypothetical protein